MTDTQEEPVEPTDAELSNALDSSEELQTDESAQRVAQSDDQDDPVDDDAGLSRRDRRYREQLRAAEAERDTLRGTVEAMQRSEVERLAADHLTKPAALWTAGVELASLIGEDGTVDPDAVLAAAQDARQQLGLEDPQAKRRRGPVVPREGTTVQSGGNSSSWKDAFKL